MARDDDELRLNTLHRFAKRSEELVLEQTSHCEIPAGCGGMILRWVKPARGISAIVDLRLDGRARLTIDGELRTNAVIQLVPGAHDVMLELETAAPTELAVRIQELVPRSGRERIFLRTLPDGTWFASTTEPGSEASWVALVDGRDDATPEMPIDGRWPSLQLPPPGASQRVWVRTRFTVEEPEPRSGGRE